MSLSRLSRRSFFAASAAASALAAVSGLAKQVKVPVEGVVLSKEHEELYRLISGIATQIWARMPRTPDLILSYEYSFLDISEVAQKLVFDRMDEKQEARNIITEICTRMLDERLGTGLAKWHRYNTRKAFALAAVGSEIHACDVAQVSSPISSYTPRSLAFDMFRLTYYSVSQILTNANAVLLGSTTEVVHFSGGYFVRQRPVDTEGTLEEDFRVEHWIQPALHKG